VASRPAAVPKETRDYSVGRRTAMASMAAAVAANTPKVYLDLSYSLHYKAGTYVASSDQRRERL